MVVGDGDDGDEDEGGVEMVRREERMMGVVGRGISCEGYC